MPAPLRDIGMGFALGAVGLNRRTEPANTRKGEMLVSHGSFYWYQGYLGSGMPALARLY
jgi:hypothetical protein